MPNDEKDTEEEKKEQENLEQKWEIKVTVLAPKPLLIPLSLKKYLP